MSEPKRYTGKTEGTVLGSPHWEHPEGEWVKWEDYARLNAEAERYRLASIRVDVGELHAQFNRALFDETVSENARLKADVERLTVADDAVKAYHEGDVNGFLTLCAIWHAANEGKQS